MKSVWILTREINEYDQDGRYFEAVFARKPSLSQLRSVGVPEHLCGHVRNGGGRVDAEHRWFFLQEHEL